MPRATRHPDSPIPRSDATEPIAPEPVDVPPTPAAASALGSLADLPVAGLTRRRIALLIAALVAAWVIVLFARQVGEASEATARADAMRTANVELRARAAGLQAELDLIQKQAFITQAAREYGLGTPHERLYTLADDAPPLPDDAPGSAKLRLGTQVARPTPLESWARLLFGEPDAAAPGD